VAWYSVTTIVVSQVEFWSPYEASILFPPLTPAQVREQIRRAGLEPAGRRPRNGRGRTALVYDAAALCDLLSCL
jgi:hypothetical protein